MRYNNSLFYFYLFGGVGENRFYNTNPYPNNLLFAKLFFSYFFYYVNSLMTIKLMVDGSRDSVSRWARAQGRDSDMVPR